MSWAKVSGPGQGGGSGGPLPSLTIPRELMEYPIYVAITDLSAVEIDIGDEPNLEGFFSAWRSLTAVPELDTSSVTNMYMMFAQTAIETVPEYDTSKVTNMSQMFSGCTRLLSVPDLDASSATNLSGIFSGCTSLQAVGLQGVRADLDLSGTALSAAALNEVFLNLAPASATITVVDTPGALTCNTSLATAKGWTVVKE